MKKILKKNQFKITFDNDFAAVISNCKEIRECQEGTWIQGGTSSNKSGKIKIGVSIWSSTDVLGSQCKKILDEAAKALDVDVQYVDQGHVSEKVTASVEQLAAAGCQGIIICNSSDTEMTSAIKTCNDNKVYLAQFFRVISQENSKDIYDLAGSKRF